MEGERKHVTVLFCDLVGSTALAERIGAEAMHGILNRFFELALTEVHRYEGTLNQFLGDGFMALFGAPIAHEDHALRAARAALGIRRGILERRIEPSLDAGALQLRMGMNTGPVVVGKIGDNLRMDYTAIGDTTNLAARMQQLAAPNEILLARNTWEAVRQHFHCDALGDRKVKGKAERVSVYRLGEMLVDRGAGSTRTVRAPTTPLVGRTHELGVLHDCVRRLRRGEGGIVGLIGEPGVGKSRLLLELRRTEALDLWWLEGHALSFGQTLSYGPLMEALCGVSGVSEHGERDEGWRKLESFLQEHLGSAAAESLPFVGMLMGLQLPSVAAGIVSRLDPQDVRGQIFIAMRRIFHALTRARPLVLELEDWHWADEASAALLEHLLPLTASEPLLVCFAGRPEADSPCARLRNLAAERYPQQYIEMLLGPLSNSEGNQLVEGVLGVQDIPPRLRGLILSKAEGNPLFIEELLRSLQAHGILHPDLGRGTLRVTGDLDAIELPDNIEAVIMARIDRLESELKQVLRLAAVIGRSFYRRILQALDKAEHQLDACLDQLQQLELVRKRRLVPEVEYMFKHALVHEASYQSILAERRRELHKRVADAIEGLFADRLDEFSGFLAYHYARAADWGNAQRYLLRAGDQAARMAADVEATAHYREAMQAYAHAFGNRLDPLQRASLERKIGEALFRLGSHDQASEHLHKTLTLLGVRYPSTRSGVRLHILGHILQQIWHQALAKHYGRRNRDPSEAELERSRAYVALTWLDYWRDEEKFFLDVISGLNWVERSGIRSSVAQGATGLAVACDVLGARRLAAYYHRRALKVAAELNDSISTASAEFGSAMHEAYVGEWDTALAGMERATNIFKGEGKLRERGIADATLTWLLQARGELARARIIITELARVADDAGDAQNRLFSKVLYAVVDMHQGRLVESAAGLDEGIETAGAIPDYQTLCQCYGNRASCALLMGDFARATAAVDQGLALLRKNRVAPHNTDSLRWGHGWLTLTLLEQSTGEDKVAALKRASRAMKDLHQLGRVFAGAVPIAHCLKGSIQWLGGEQAFARRSWSLAIAAAEHLSSRFYLAVIHQEMGRQMRVRPHLDEGLRLFEDIGCAFQVARTLRYLGQTMAEENQEAAARFFERALTMHALMSAEHELRLIQAGYQELRGRMPRDTGVHNPDRDANAPTRPV